MPTFRSRQTFGLPKFRLAGLYCTVDLQYRGFAKTEQVSEAGILFSSTSFIDCSILYCGYTWVYIKCIVMKIEWIIRYLIGLLRLYRFIGISLQKWILTDLRVYCYPPIFLVVLFSVKTNLIWREDDLAFFIGHQNSLTTCDVHCWVRL